VALDRWELTFSEFFTIVVTIIAGVAIVACYLWVAAHEPEEDREDDGDSKPVAVTVRGMSTVEILLAAILIVDIAGLIFMIARR
jgi:heme/copper-type cytochrome/quinol oxidase subunit 2